MSSYVDFQELKAKVEIEQVLEWLGIKLSPRGAQLRGACPIHQGDNQSAFVVTPSKGLWNCFTSCGGGDIIKLVMKMKKLEAKEAAQLIAEHFGTVTVDRQNTTVPPSRSVLQPLAYLQSTHEAVQALGLSPETCDAFGAGYAAKGILRGRLAIPLHDKAGTLVAYCGQTVKNEVPFLSFPSNFDPHSLIFNAHRLEPGGDLYLVQGPLGVLLAHENGTTNVISFLTDSIRSPQWEMLSLLQDEKQLTDCYRF